MLEGQGCWLLLDSAFGDVPSNFQMDDVDCTGYESSLWDCQYTQYDNCGSTEGAGVVCSEPIRKCRFRSITTV